MKITALDIMPLEAYYSLANVNWEARYGKTHGTRNNNKFRWYLLPPGHLRVTEGLYLYHGDEQKFYEENGLLLG